LRSCFVWKAAFVDAASDHHCGAAHRELQNFELPSKAFAIVFDLLCSIRQADFLDSLGVHIVIS
jgi:hypothetical protein